MAVFASIKTPRELRAVLSGLCRRNFYGEEIEYEDLAEAIYDEASGSKEDAVQHIVGVERLLRRAAKEHWDGPTLETNLAATEMKAEHRAAFAKFWKGERNAVHDAMQKKTTWTAHLKQLSWRIDVKTSSKDMVRHSLSRSVTQSLSHSVNPSVFPSIRQSVSC